MSGETAILMTRLKECLAKPRPHELKCLKKTAKQILPDEGRPRVPAVRYGRG